MKTEIEEKEQDFKMQMINLYLQKKAKGEWENVRLPEHIMREMENRQVMYV